MSAKKEKQAIWKVLFLYLVASKVLYYFGLITSAINRGGFGAMVETLLTRMLTQDILIILVLLLTYNTDKLLPLISAKIKREVDQRAVHIIDYVLYMMVLAAYFWVMLFLDFFQTIDWRIFIIYSSSVYFAIVLAAEGKKYLKKKEMTEYTHVLNADEKLIMLKTLFENNVLTKEEYDRKKEVILCH